MTARLLNVFQLLTIIFTDKLRRPLSVKLLILDTVNFTLIKGEHNDHIEHILSSIQLLFIKHLS